MATIKKKLVNSLGKNLVDIFISEFDYYKSSILELFVRIIEFILEQHHLESL